MAAVATHHRAFTPSLPPAASPAVASEFRFESLAQVSQGPEPLARGRTFTASLGMHSLIVLGILLLPLMWDTSLPAVPDELLKAFFVMPQQAPPPPPPPPPPRAAAAHPQKTTPPPSQSPARFLAPIDVPPDVKPEPAADLGIDTGVPGGVEGGVSGGVVGGIVGGLPTAPAPVTQVVRVGGAIKAPKRLHAVAPEYPRLATAARVSGVVVVEAHVDTHGRVRDTRIVSGHALLDEAATAAVLQWRYQPLLLNGVPMEFLLTVTVKFSLTEGPAASS